MLTGRGIEILDNLLPALSSTLKVELSVRVPNVNQLQFFLSAKLNIWDRIQPLKRQSGSNHSLTRQKSLSRSNILTISPLLPYPCIPCMQLSLTVTTKALQHQHEIRKPMRGISILIYSGTISERRSKMAQLCFDIYQQISRLQTASPNLSLKTTSLLSEIHLVWSNMPWIIKIWEH